MRQGLTRGFLLLILFHASALAQSATFTGVGDLPTGIFQSYAHALSDDGTTVVGETVTQADVPGYYWKNNVMTGLPIQAGPASAVSANGSAIIGNKAGNAYRWTQASGVVHILDFQGSGNSFANGISPDGGTVLGHAYSDANSGYQAYRWTAAGGTIGLSDLAGGAFESRAVRASANGTVIVGYGTSAIGYEAFRWTAASGLVTLGAIPGGTGPSEATDVSADGSVIVGSAYTPAGLEAFRWTASGGMQPLGFLSGGGAYSSALGVSPDGLFIVGESDSSTGRDAFIWDASNGMRSLTQLLAATGAGLDMAGWSGIDYARDIAIDHRTIIGTATNPAGHTEGWVAVLPEPAAAALALAPMLLMRRRRAR